MWPLWRLRPCLWKRQKQILMQADEGNVTLSTQQRQILQSTRDLLNAARIHALQNRAIDDLQEMAGSPGRCRS